MEILGNEENKKILEFASKENLPTLIIGDTGCGKTSIVQAIGKVKKQQVIRFNLTGETTVDDFVGRKGLKAGETLWEDGVLLKAMREGYWLIVDEINSALPEILFVLHPLLDDSKEVLVTNNENEIVKPHKDFRFFATMNPVDEYAGTKELNKAFKSRFDIVLQMGYPNSTVEQEIIMSRTKVSLEQAFVMVNLASRVRKMKEKEEIFYTLSTRDLIQWGNLTKNFGLDNALELSILNKSDGDKEKIFNEYCNVNDRVKTILRDNDEDSMEAVLKKLENINQYKKQIEKKIRKDLIEDFGRISVEKMVKQVQQQLK